MLRAATHPGNSSSHSPTASDLVAKYIRDTIASGLIDEGKPIRQDEVAQRFRVSKIPVREALKTLEAEGLVVFHRNRGAIVASISDPEISEIFEVRALLESYAIRLSVPNMTSDTLAKASLLREAFAADTDVSRWAQLNWQFHSCLYEDAGRPFLVNLIRSVNDRIEKYLRIQLSLSNGQKTADREHREILKACRDGDASLAAKLVRQHIEGARKSLLRHLPRQRQSHSAG